MAEAEDYDFSSTDAGSADAVPIEAGQIRKGGFMVIKGRPCKVNEVSHSKTGKHGAAKCNFDCYDIFNNKKYQDMQPASAGCLQPIITRTEYTLVDIDAEDSFLTLMTEEGETREDLKLPTYPEGYGDDIQAKFDEGKQLILTVLKSMGEEQVIGDKEDTS
eukprot:CAMPEP_0205904078 /NCGR_PEP_ID=MMETSP1325-20131115/493_1 /ASSEMBLY_ACC=CAM_ASM_000708 /TAXON_ID=236786 /ORGANISM="Florenciella sp., Strain RCC1007" /LENGTH=160 /DNA_ID=CAMNT_0053269801 /DNA_START=43 /DNA_END=525 /DNA_ORIENTATION=-